MPEPARVDIYLEPPLRASAETGAHNFIGKMAAVLEKANVRVAFRPIDGPPGDREALVLSHMAPVPDRPGLIFRRCYHYPFWQIEARPERWLWDVAAARFDPEGTDPSAARFYRFWQRRLFGQAPASAHRDGPVYVALQGRLLQRRTFQSCTPIEMLEHVLAQDDRPVLAALHPKESYSTAERAALEVLAARHPRLKLTIGGMERHLQSCPYVVTQNSAAAFSGYFFGKPALLFGECDFHHIGVAAKLSDLAACFDAVRHAAPDYAGYVHWFWQEMCINAGRPEAEDRIAARFRRFGWPV